MGPGTPGHLSTRDLARKLQKLFTRGGFCAAASDKISCVLFISCILLTVKFSVLSISVVAAASLQVKQIATDYGLKVQRKADKAGMIDQIMKLHSKQQL